MADQLQLRGGTTSEHSTFTGALREVTVDTDKDVLVVHDNSTAGGHPLMAEDGSNSALALGSAGTPSLKFTGDTDTGVFSPAADTVGVSTGGTEQIRIDSSGNVGIGTTTVDELLHIEQNVNNYGPTFKISNPNTGRWGGKIDFESATGAGTYTAATIKGDGGGGFGSGNLIVETAGSERCRVDGSGRLLVGTTTASTQRNDALLQIEAGSNGNAINVRARSSDDRYAYINLQNNTGSETAASIHVDRSATNAGILMFGTTADGASSPTERMRIAQDGRQDSFSSNASNAFVWTVAGSNSSINNLFLLRNSSSGFNTGTSVLAITMNGNVYNQNNSYGSLSDAKLKENIVDASSQWGDLKAIQVRKYNFKEETGKETHTQIGVVAQEIELVSPGLVTESPDRDENGNDLGTTTKSVNYSVLYMKAVKALQEAMERIETLEAKVTALEAN